MTARTAGLAALLALAACDGPPDDLDVDCFTSDDAGHLDYGLLLADAPPGAFHRDFVVRNICPSARILPPIVTVPRSDPDGAVRTSAFTSRVPAGGEVDVGAFVVLTSFELVEQELRLQGGQQPLATISAQLDPEQRLVRRVLPTLVTLPETCGIELELQLAYDGPARLDFDSPVVDEDTSPDWQATWDPPPPWSLGQHSPGPHRLILALPAAPPKDPRRYIAELPILSVMQGQVPASVSASFGADASFELVWNVTSDASVQSIPLGVTPVPDTLSVSMAGSEVPFSYDEDSNTMIVDGAPVGATLTIRGEPRCVQ